MGTTVSCSEFRELKVFARAAEMVVFPEPGPPAREIMMRLLDDGGYRDSRASIRAHKVCSGFSMLLKVLDLAKYEVEWNKCAAETGDIRKVRNVNKELNQTPNFKEGNGA